MMSSEETSSPVSASTFMYLMRWPVLRLIWLKLIFSESEVAGNNATGQVTRERRKKPFQLARGAMDYSKHNRVQPEIISFRCNSTKMLKVNLFRDGERDRRTCAVSGVVTQHDDERCERKGNAPAG